MEQLKAQLNGTDCTVCVGAGLMRRAGTLLRQQVPAVRRWALAADGTVCALYGELVLDSLRAAGLQVSLYLLPAGESAKTPEAWLSLCRRILRDGFDRGCGVVTLGGGACGDAAGFAAATLLRGVALAHIPTTLLAQADSAVGGKTALDVPEGKNLLGAFHQPSLVLSDTACLATLPPRQFAGGMAEVIKTGCVADAGLLELAERGLSPEDTAGLTAAATACCRAKLRLASGDVEDHGARRLLNFGHTFGHAWEAAGGFEAHTHGEAVAAGMCRTLRWQASQGYQAALLPRLERVLEQYGLPTDMDCGADALREYILRDKKAGGDTITLAIVQRPGAGELVSVPLRALWEETV